MKKLCSFIATIFCSLVFSLPAAWAAQAGVEKASPLSGQSDDSDLQAQRTRYRWVIAELAEVESEIFKLHDSDAQRAFKKVQSTVVGLQAKRTRLRELEGQWEELGEGKKSALEIEPRLNHTERSERQMLVELEGSHEKILRLKSEILKLNNDFGPSHPRVAEISDEISKVTAVAKEQKEALEEMGVEVTSSVAKTRLRTAMLRQVELKSKFGTGHPDVVLIAAEIEMLEGEVQQAPDSPRSSATPSIELVNANLELQEAENKLGKGHPTYTTLKQKIDVLEKLAQAEEAEEAPKNKVELAKRLANRIETLQNQIFDDEAKLDSISENKVEFKRLEEKNSELLKKREALSSEMARLAPALDSAKRLGEEPEDRERLSRQLLEGIDALESLGKTEEATRLRQVLSGLKN